MQYTQQGVGLSDNYQSRIYALINTEIQKLNKNQLFLVYNMLKLMQQPVVVQSSAFQVTEFFAKSQQALMGITGNLSDDVISDRNERQI